jgi:hypothetical protein
MYKLLLFHGNNGFANAPHCYDVRTLSLLFPDCKVRHTLHTHLHLRINLIRRTSGQSLGTFRQNDATSDMRQQWIEQYFHNVHTAEGCRNIVILSRAMLSAVTEYDHMEEVPGGKRSVPQVRDTAGVSLQIPRQVRTAHRTGRRVGSCLAWQSNQQIPLPSYTKHANNDLSQAMKCNWSFVSSLKITMTSQIKTLCNAVWPILTQSTCLMQFYGIPTMNPQAESQQSKTLSNKTTIYCSIFGSNTVHVQTLQVHHLAGNWVVIHTISSLFLSGPTELVFCLRRRTDYIWTVTILRATSRCVNFTKKVESVSV